MTRRCRSLLLSRKAIVLLSVAVLGACAAPHQDVAKPEPLPPVAGVASPGPEDWLRFADSVRRYNAGEFARELEQVRQGFVLEQRLEEALEQAQQKTREEQRRADAAEQRATQALIKLDTLRSLEQNLYRRRSKDKY